MFNNGNNFVIYIYMYKYIHIEDGDIMANVDVMAFLL